MKKLTDENFWAKYWKNKNNYKKVTRSYPFNDLFETLLHPRAGKSMIEIGGFPGYFAIYFKKYLGYHATILDNFVDHKIIQKVLVNNSLKKQDLVVIKHDFFTYRTKKQYDLVYSLGFLEHFDDTGLVLARHWQLVKKGGEMLVIIPNFQGLNGHIQLTWDPDNLQAHNLSCMDVDRLKAVLKSLKIKESKVMYWGGLRVWLENWESRSIWQKLVVSGLYIIGMGVKWLGINNRLLSPYIIIYAKK